MTQFKFRWFYQPKKRRTTLHLINVETKQDVAKVISIRNPEDEHNKKIAKTVTFRKLINKIREEGLLGREERIEVGELFKNKVTNVKW